MKMSFLNKSLRIVVLTCGLSITTWALTKLFLKTFKTRRKNISQLITKPKVVVVTKSSDWEEIASEFLSSCNHFMVIGFDCEWTNNKGPVSLIQLATPNEFCILIRLCKFQPFYNLPQDLLDLLANPKILKVGVNPNGDAAKLFKNNIFVNGHLDIGWLAFEATCNNVISYGLKGLSNQFLGIKLDKSFEIRCSNWDADFLSERQINYAANDALVAVKLFIVLAKARMNVWEKLKENLNASPTSIPGFNPKSSIYKWIHRPFNASKVQNMKSTIKTKGNKVLKKVEKIETKKGYLIRKSPLYHNCILQAPDGQPLCTCGTKKAQWYLDQSLADLISEDPLTVRLRFEPCGRPTSENDYYLQKKENVCVVCGRPDCVIRKNVIPQEYRKHFPTNLKEHKSHDVVLLCLPCHQFSNVQDYVLKQQLAEKYNAPLGSGANTKINENRDNKQIRSVARALTKSGIPDSRRKELQTVLCKYFHVDELTGEILNRALKIDTRIENEDYIQHGYQVVKSIKDVDGLLKFEQLWRHHFLTSNSPLHMPKMWSVNHKQNDETPLN